METEVSDTKKKREKRGLYIRRAIAIFTVIVFVVTPVILFRVATDRLVGGITQTISLQHAQELNAQMSSNIANSLEHYFQQLNTEYNALKLVEGLDEDELRAFIAETEAQNGFSYLAFADTEGNIYETGNSGAALLRLPLLGKLLKGADRIITDNETIDSENFIVLGVSFDDPIQVGDHSVCIAILGMHSDDLTDQVSLNSDFSGGYTSIITLDGSYVIKNPSEPYDGLNAISVLRKNYSISEAELEDLRTKIRSGKTAIINAQGLDSVQYAYLYFAPIAGTDWYAVNTLPDDFVKSSVVGLRNSLERVSTFCVIFILIVAATVIFALNYSNRKLQKSHRETEKALQAAERASSAKTTFLFSMSHDIRTPMNAILGFTDIGLKNVTDPKIAGDSFGKIKLAGGHLLDLINDILEMSRIESGKLTLAEEAIDIRTAIEGVDTMSRSLAAEKNIDFETVVDELPNPYIYADELHINEVIINIISNAVKYTPAGGSVRYSVSQPGVAENGKVLYRFEISDNGIGMSEEFQKRLFEPFSRENSTTVSKTEGTGLGLSIVKRIVDMAGGSVSVQSEQHKGSVFTVEIPFKVLTDEEIGQFAKKNSDSSTVEHQLSGSRVLLAEDNELNREIALYILEDAGLQVDTASDGDVAVKTVSEKGAGYYDFILMDIQMPVMDGFAATRAIRKLPGGAQVPIIALSANAFEDDRRKSAEAGMNAHVAKPIDIKVLLETMNSLFGATGSEK